jgi:hypothetical protein
MDIGLRQLPQPSEGQYFAPRNGVLGRITNPQPACRRKFSLKAKFFSSLLAQP